MFVFAAGARTPMCAGPTCMSNVGTGVHGSALGCIFIGDTSSAEETERSHDGVERRPEALRQFPALPLVFCVPSSQWADFTFPSPQSDL